ncbi:hypothetical protein DBR37_05795 [Herminiimonas sp. KBW02]|uniref:hypothetical protein n=1 Tax=Herminiimonas sp. KBW02 TaxID=2153363 RepID=UPI000F599B4D|nr:hypothetical protein [Herminiimonas sp. KBW02]RQO35871.1 hypothetical protein DBR37_05795 [Herminiimonas sp. KBW02]
MLQTTLSIEKNIDSISKIATAAFKFGILVGGFCVIGYSIKIGHFPQDVSLGDGLLFLMTAGFFGIIYALFIASMVCLGITLSPILTVFVRIWTWFETKYSKDGKKTKAVHQLVQCNWQAAVISILAIFIIILLGRGDPFVYLNLPLLSIGLYLFYSLYISCGRKIKEIYAIKDSRFELQDSAAIGWNGDVEKFRQTQMIAVGVIFIIPLLGGGVTGQLLDAAMRAANVRIEKPILYVQEPYTSLLPKALVSEDHNVPHGYTAFEGITVLFSGFGKTAFVAFPEGGKVRKLEIANDKVIIERR